LTFLVVTGIRTSNSDTPFWQLEQHGCRVGVLRQIWTVYNKISSRK